MTTHTDTERRRHWTVRECPQCERLFDLTYGPDRAEWECHECDGGTMFTIGRKA